MERSFPETKKTTNFKPNQLIKRKVSRKQMKRLHSQLLVR